MKKKLMALALTSTMVATSATSVFALSKTEVNTKIQNTKKELNSLDKTKDSINQKKNSVIDDINAKELNLTSIKSEMDSVIENKQKNEQELIKIEKELNKNMAALRNKLVEWYINQYTPSADSMLHTLISSESISDFIITNTHLEYIVDDQNIKVDTIKTLLQKQKDVLNKIKADEDRLSKLQEKLNSEIKNLTELKKEYNIELSSISEKEDSLSKLLQEQEAEAQKIDDEIRRAQEEARRQAELASQNQSSASNNESSHVQSSSEWITPLNSYVITSRFGRRVDPINGAIRYHNGTDLAAPTGTTIKAANSGRVIISKYSTSYGNYVVIDHGNGLSSLYAHMSQRSVSVGQHVSGGQKIGEVGTTGRSTGPHLHLECRKMGNRIDAASIIPV